MKDISLKLKYTVWDKSKKKAALKKIVSNFTGFVKGSFFCLPFFLNERNVLEFVVYLCRVTKKLVLRFTIYYWLFLCKWAIAKKWTILEIFFNISKIFKTIANYNFFKNFFRKHLAYLLILRFLEHHLFL